MAFAARARKRPAAFARCAASRLPAYRAARGATGDRDRAAVQALFALIAHVADSNLLWRGGRDGPCVRAAQRAGFPRARRRARAAIGATQAVAHRIVAFVAAGLSPGGSADLLAVTLFLDELDRAACTAA